MDGSLGNDVGVQSVAKINRVNVVAKGKTVSSQVLKVIESANR